MPSVTKKIFVLLITLSLCFSSAGATKARADVWTGTDWANLVQNTGTFAESTVGNLISGAKYTWDALGKNLLDAAAYAAAQNLLNQLTQNTIQWIKGGFHGSPSFAVDTKEIGTRIADNIAGGMVLSLRNIAVCDFTLNYKDDLVNTIDISAKKQPYLYNQKATCPFRQDYGFKASEFYQDFNNGMWRGFGAALNDGGNPYGLQLVTAQEQASRQSKAQADKDKQLSWSNGFTNIVDTNSCAYPSDVFYYEGQPDPKSLYYPIISQGLPFPEGVSEAEIQASYLTKQEAQTLNEQTFSDPARAKAMQDAYCQTTTPGKIVGDQLSQTLGLDMQKIGFADNMNKIVAAFLDTLTQKTIRAVFGTGNKSTGPGGLPTSSTGSSVVTPIIAVTTFPANPITKNSAVINGYITAAPASSQVQVWFVLGTTPGSGQLLSTPISATSVGQRFNLSATNLQPSTTYFFNTVATTGGRSPDQTSSTLHGAELSFTTPSQ